MTDTAPTPREIEVAALLARGLRNKEIADRLGITDKTVKSHVSSFAKRLGLPWQSSRVAVALAYLRLCDDVERDRIIGCSAPLKGYVRALVRLDADTMVPA